MNHNKLQINKKMNPIFKEIRNLIINSRGSINKNETVVKYTLQKKQ